MGVNKIEYCGNTLIDLTKDTATAANVLKDKTFHLKSGEAATGSMTNRGAVTATIDEQNGVYKIPKGYHNGSGTVTATYGGYNVVTGTYAGTTSTKSFTVSGLGFRPSNVIITTMAQGSTSFTGSTYMLNISTLPVINPNSGSNIYAITSSLGMKTGQPITINDDGFTCTRSSESFPYIYLYVAWG